MRQLGYLLFVSFLLWQPPIASCQNKVFFGQLQDSVLTLLKQGQESEAIPLWEKTLQQAVNADSLLSYLDLVKNIARYYRNQENELDQALTIFQRGTQEYLWREPCNVDEAKSLAWLYSQIAFTYDIKMGNYLKAVEAYESAEQLFAAWDYVDASVVRFIWWRLGNIYTRLGDNSAAELKLQQVVRQMKEGEGNAPYWVAEAYNDLGLLYKSWDRNEDALKAYRAGLDEPLGQPLSKILLRLNYFDVLIATKQQKEAVIQLDLAKDALTLQQDNERFFLIASLVCKKEAVIALEEKSYPEATKALDEDYDHLKSFYGTTQRREFGKHYNQYGQLYIDQGDYQSAIKKYQEALKSTLYNYEPSGLYDLPSSDGLYAENTIAEALDNMVEAYRLWYEEEPVEKKLITALQCHKLIYAVEQELRRSYLYDSSKLINLEESRDRSEQGIALAQQLFELTDDEQYLHEAFVFAERNRSSLLREAYRTAQASALAGVSKEELAEEEALKYQISEAQEELFRLRATADVPDSLIQQAEQQLFQARATLDNWITELEANNPRYFQLKYADGVPGIDTLQEMLCGQQLMIEYFLGKEQLYVFTLDKKELRLHQLPLPEALQDRIVAWRRNIQDYQYIGVDKTKMKLAYQQEAYRLYQELLVPILGTNKDYKELLIVPSGILDLLPFEALLTQPVVEQLSFQEHPYLLHDYTVSYTYSASLQWSLSQLPRQGNGRIGFAPEFNGDGGWAPISCSGEMLQKEFDEEQQDKLKLNKEATIAEFNALAGRYRLLHLATHAQANPEQGDFSFIVFSDGLGGYDSLFVKDLYTLNIEAELVILSACETALGTIYNSEGGISLARGFHFAGARSVLTTLWSINEGANCDLMPEFYHQLNQGKSKKDALHAAKLAFLQGDPGFTHPVYWAGFQLLGNPRPLNEKSYRWWIGLSFLAIGLGYVGYRSYRTNN